MGHGARLNSAALLLAVPGSQKAGRPSLVYCGDHQGAKDVAAELLRDVGFEPVDAGPEVAYRFLSIEGIL